MADEAGRIHILDPQLFAFTRQHQWTYLGSTYSVDDHAIYDGLSRPGVRIVSFAPILKHAVFPLAAMLDQLMSIGEDALGRPVEIEFAAQLARRPQETANFGFLPTLNCEPTDSNPSRLVINPRVWVFLF